MRRLPQTNTERKSSLITTLSNGFDQTARHIWIILIPLIVDTFYWIGPRLSIQKLVEESAAVLKGQPAVANLADQMLEVGSQYNLITSLSVPIIGFPAVMGGAVPEKTPVIPITYQIENSISWLLIFLGLSLLGLALTTVYFHLIDYVLQENKPDRRSNRITFSGKVLKNYLRLISLGIVFVLCMLAVWLPITGVAVLAGLVNSTLSLLILMLGLVLSVFIVAYLSLTIPAIISADRSVFAAIRESILLVHSNLSSLLGLLLIVVLIGSGTRLLWQLADNGSWMTLLNIAGNAFISTALVMVIFIYFRDHTEDLQPQTLS